MSHLDRFVPTTPVGHSNTAALAGFVLHNPGGPVSINPQPLPPRVFAAPLLSRAILER